MPPFTLAGHSSPCALGESRNFPGRELVFFPLSRGEKRRPLPLVLIFQTAVRRGNRKTTEADGLWRCYLHTLPAESLEVVCEVLLTIPPSLEFEMGLIAGSATWGGY